VEKFIGGDYKPAGSTDKHQSAHIFAESFKMKGLSFIPGHRVVDNQRCTFPGGKQDAENNEYGNYYTVKYQHNILPLPIKLSCEHSY
jgi:hypothetical protein